MCAHGPVRGASWSFVSIGLFMLMNGVRLLPLTPAQSAGVVVAEMREDRAQKNTGVA